MQLALNLPPMAEAQARGQLGMERAIDHAEREEPGWTEQAVEAIRLYAQGRGDDLFNTEMARLAVEGFVPAPPDKRSWGAATKRAAALGYIELVDGEFIRAASSNASWKQAYRKGPKA
jgi:hypothetical protein